MTTTPPSKMSLVTGKVKIVDNSLRDYNRSVLRRSRMHLYTKKHVDSIASKVLLKEPRVVTIKLTAEDIEQYKLDFNDEKFRLPKKPQLEENQEKNKRQLEEKQEKNKMQLEEKQEKNKRQLEENLEKNKKAKLEEGKGPVILKLVLSREGETDKFKSKFKSIPSIDNDNENALTSSSVSRTTENTMGDDIAEPTKSFNSLIGKIKVREPHTMIDETKIERFHTLFLEKNFPKVQRTIIKKVVIPSNQSLNANPVGRGHLSLKEIEELYQKYFSKSVQDSIVIIANILNIISLSNKHHKSRMDESFKKRSEAEKLKERCDANRIHTRHKKILETKLKTYFNLVIASFSDEEFETAFQMFFLSILTVLRVLDQPKFKKGSIFKNLVLLLWNSLKSTEFEHPKIFTMFRSKSFRPDCIDLISLIEDTRDSDPSITDRMALFFVSSVSSKDCFRGVINTITDDSSEDLGLLIENAAQQLRSCSRFKEPQPISSPKDTTTDSNSSVTSDVNNSTDPIQWVLAKGPNGLYQSVSVTNNSQKIKTPESTNKPLNAFYETFSNSLIAKVSSESVNNPVAIAPKVSIVTTASIPNGPSRGTPTIVTFKPSIHNMKPLPANTIQRSDSGNTIYLGKTKYQVVRAAARIHQNSNNSVVLKPQQKSLDVASRCYAEHCDRPATIMCSTCTSVKYCSHDCQRLDWYASHIQHCDKLRRKQNSL